MGLGFINLLSILLDYDKEGKRRERVKERGGKRKKREKENVQFNKPAPLKRLTRGFGLFKR